MLESAHGLTLGDVSRENRRRFGRRTGIVCGETRLAYADLDERVSRLANVLRARGCTDGSAVVWVGQNCHRVLELLLAAGKIGAALCPANWRWSPDELRFAIDDLKPEVVVWHDAEEIAARVDAARNLCQDVRSATGREVAWIAAEGAGGYEELVKSADSTDREEPIDPFAPVLLIYTSAFGGRPNAAELTHMSLLLMGLLEAPWQRIDHDFTYLNSGPMFHVGNWRTTIPTYQYGGKNVVVARVDAEEMCSLIEDEQCNAAYLVPTTRERLEAANANGDFDLTSLRDDGGSERWRAMVTPVPGRTIYGQTEVGGHIVSSIIGPPPEGGSGRAIPVAQVRIVDEAGIELPIAEVGEIVVRGPVVIRGYRGRPELNEARFRDGWWHTGDVGRREKDGSITFVGPKQRMIKSGLENIYPAEVERCLRLHPSISDCAVIGTPDDAWGQSVKALIVPRAGDHLLAPSDVIGYCAERIAAYKKPRSVEFVAEIPRVDGAVDYDALDSLYGGGGYPGA